MTYDRPALPAEIVQAIESQRICLAVPKDQRDVAWVTELFRLCKLRIAYRHTLLAAEFQKLLRACTSTIENLSEYAASEGKRVQRDGVTPNGKMRLLQIRDVCQSILTELKAPLFITHGIEIDLVSIEFVSIGPREFPGFVADIEALNTAINAALNHPNTDSGREICSVAAELHDSFLKYLARQRSRQTEISADRFEARIVAELLREFECSGALESKRMTARLVRLADSPLETGILF